MSANDPKRTFDFRRLMTCEGPLNPIPRHRGLASRNSLMRPRTEPDNAQDQRREDSDIQHCINHASLH
jgi:hypothetical protein